MARTAKQEEKVIKGELLSNKIIIEEDFEHLTEKSYGKLYSDRLEIGFVEALYLLEKKKIKIKQDRKAVSFKALMVQARRKDKRIHEKFAVYRDLRDRGLVVKTGFKFGCDFRVYQRGVSVKKGPKSSGEHTKWIVYAVPEDYRCAFQELSRAVRLAHSIRANMLWAIVDNENDVTYMEVVRIKP